MFVYRGVCLCVGRVFVCRGVCMLRRDFAIRCVRGVC